MKIGIDLDGVITKAGLYNPSVRLPWWLFYLLIPIVSKLKPDKMVVKKLQAMKNEGCQVLIVTARPRQFAQKTEQWLKLHYVPFDSLFCVGFGKGTKERKLKVIHDEKIEMFIDDNRNFIKFLKNNAINATYKIERPN